MINRAALFQLNHYTTILPLHSMSNWLVDYICAKLIDWWKWVILTAYWVLAYYKHCSSLLFMINMQKTSEVDELQAPCCYSYFSSQDEFMHIKPRTCSTAITHEAQQAQSWYWLCWDDLYMLFMSRKSYWNEVRSEREIGQKCCIT